MGFSAGLRAYSVLTLIVVQVAGQGLASTFPHIYPGIPNNTGNFSDSAAWQDYFMVKDALPNVTFPSTRSFAGNLPVNRQGHPNNTLFFWGFERTNGSLTLPGSQDPWVIWLNGGPGSSSMLGLLLENGPIHFNPDFSAFSNNFSWNNAADTFWIDQPVGTGWSTSDIDAFVSDEDQMGIDFLEFLSNLVQVFPGLATRPLFLTGESYSGVFIPYIAKESPARDSIYFSLSKPPVVLSKIAIGDGAYASDNTVTYASMVSVIETYPQLIAYDTGVLDYFKEQSHLCGYDVNLTYPQDGIIPTFNPPLGSAFQDGSTARERLLTLTHPKMLQRIDQSLASRKEGARRAWKRDLPGRPNGAIDPWYGCDLLDELTDYALNFSVPWAGNHASGFDVYDVPDALDPEAAPNPDTLSVFLNDPRVVAAVHAPTSHDWAAFFTPHDGYPFGGRSQGDPSPLPMDFFSELASNLSAHGIHWVLYSGNADALIPHLGTEIVIQNTTFGGIQGFTKRPSTPWLDGAGNSIGKVHQERNLTYVLFADAGHQVPEFKPAAALAFLKEFILGNNSLGTVLTNGTVVGGTNATLAQDVLTGDRDPIFFGSGVTQGSTFYPSATIAGWEKSTAATNATATAVAAAGNITSVAT